MTSCESTVSKIGIVDFSFFANGNEMKKQAYNLDLCHQLKRSVRVRWGEEQLTGKTNDIVRISVDHDSCAGLCEMHLLSFQSTVGIKAFWCSHQVINNYHYVLLHVWNQISNNLIKVFNMQSLWTRTKIWKYYCHHANKRADCTKISTFYVCHLNLYTIM